jgi:N-methylhydantoinase A
VLAPLLVMHSAGGVATEAHSRNKPITTLFSGPAGGIVASMRVAEAVGFRNVVCADVGGTTFDVGLIVDGRPLLRSTSIIDQRVMYCPTIDLISIGAGGGSIARVHPATGRLVVGPESAGAAPGPACYGRGGDYPTVTDANLVLGYMDPDRFLGGRFKLDRQAAIDALRRHVAEPLGIEVAHAAAAIFAIVNAKMADLVRKITVERGHDPRDFALCAYGGLGPLHAPFYAGDLNAKAVMIPLGELSSVFSAFGIATSDILHVREMSTHLLEASALDLDALFDRLVVEADDQLAADGIAAEDRLMRRFIEVRYVGQLNGMSIALQERAVPGAVIRAEYERLYADAFGPGAAWDEAPIEIVGLRLEALGRRRKAALTHCDPRCPAPEPLASRPVYWPQVAAFVPTRVFGCSAVGPGWVIPGPAIVEFKTTTITIPPGWTCTSDRFGNLLLTMQAPGEDAP